MNVNAMMSASRNRSLFTPTQWQELEHQALIFKYMVSGVPVPPDLILTVKRSLDASMVFSHTPIGWGGLQMGYGGKTDPEPGRCRRTDGKKWRCSKEAHPDSKYCERHMHRGKSRSRKLVEISAAATATATTSPNSSSASTTPTSSFKKSCLPSQSSNTHHHHHHHLFLDSGSYSLAEKEYGFLNGVGERAFFAERSGTVRSLNDSFTPLTMNSSGEMNFQRVADRSSEEEHCFVLGTDFKSAKSVAGEEETQKPFHHFLGEWVPKGKESSWLELDTSESNTQLSISMPSFSTADLFQSNSRPYW